MRGDSLPGKRRKRKRHGERDTERERHGERETPSLSLRLRLVRYARADSDVLRTSSNRVLSRSVGVSLPFERGMTKVAATV